MWSSWFAVLLFLPVHSTSNCVHYDSEEKTCNGSRCYARTIRHREGAVQQLGCLTSNLAEDTLSCEDHLHWNETEEICVESGRRQVCCCLAGKASSTPCNSVWQLRTVPPVVSHKDFCLLLLALAFSIVLPVGLRQLLRHRLIQVAMKMRTSILRLESIAFVLKVLVLLLFFIVSWVPSSPACPLQPDGVVQLREEFLFQAASYLPLNWLIFVLPLACLLLDVYRLYRVRQDGIPVRQFIHPGLVSIVISALCGWLILWNHMRLMSEEKTNHICKKTMASWQLLATGILLTLYALLGLIHQCGSWQQRRMNGYFVLEEEREARNKEVDLMLDDGPITCMDTALSVTTSREEEYLDFFPRPFTLDGDGEGILTIRNTHLSDWVAIRLLCSVPLSYSIHPHKLVLPPQREVTISVRTNGYRSPQQEVTSKPTLMIQWFSVNSSAMLMDATCLWQKPFVQPRHQWKFFVLPIFHEQ